jgi:predicted nucleic-acid-binding protein
MIGLDTIVLVRHIVQDNQEECQAAYHLIESSCTKEDPGVVSLVVLCELIWVLDRGYRYHQKTIATGIGLQTLRTTGNKIRPAATSAMHPERT